MPPPPSPPFLCSDIACVCPGGEARRLSAAESAVPYPLINYFHSSTLPARPHSAFGAAESAAYVKKLAFPTNKVAFDAAFDKKKGKSK